MRTFESVARHASFKRAAFELSVTPTAVSHQIRQLEDNLGTRLLDRNPRQVLLTPVGADLYEAAAAALKTIGDATRRVRHGAGPAKVTLSANTAFMSQWLVPRLTELQAMLPSVDLRLHASDELVDLRHGEVDIAIRYGPGGYPNANSVKLIDDVFAPVCSPSLGLTDRSALHRAVLLHIDGRRAPRATPDWPRWCATAQVDGLDVATGPRFTDGGHAIQAAIAGHGIVIVSLILVADALAAGLLVQPFAVVLPGDSYHFVRPLDAPDSPAIAALRSWMMKALRPYAA
ncbi:LysR substrate-binding domain-containing protein [Sphingomonas alpina]|uniref:LysR substrate-binding domain-containing protein n=1 Tax=Sphingomonas alpina TaxID=653931 RepID=UPI0021BBA47F|nr:LysR substrate-binding domain-containing protein [Sphingomonas alpina]